MSRPLVKVCGVKDPAFAAEAARLGVDYIGVIFAEGSPRRVSVAQARAVAAAAAEGAGAGTRPRIAGVFAGAPADEIVRIAGEVPLDVVQLHGGYGAGDVAALKERGLEVWRLAEDGACEPAGEDAALLDGRAGGRCGGTGARADWELARRLKAAGRRIVLAGGISEANAAAAAETGADVLDVNSSLETAPGEKSAELLRRFVAAANMI